IGQYLEGDKYKLKMSDDAIYKMLSTYINRDFDNLERFMKAAKMDVEDLQYKITVDRALKGHIIKVSDGYYQRGNVTLGKNLQEVYDTLKKPQFATEFLSIKEEVESR